MDALIEAGRSSNNADERLEIYKNLAIKLDEINNNLPIFYSSLNVGANAKVEGFVMDSNGYHPLNNVQVLQ